MSLPSFYDLGIDSGDYKVPTISISYTNWDLDEGLPDDELTEVTFVPDFRGKLPEECPEECAIPVIDEEDYGNE